jgi:predicted nucleic acid-binding protein
MIIISDTTPIISLIKIQRLDLLEKLFGEVLIPEAVFRELTTNETFKNEATIVKSSKFIKTSPIKNKKSLEILQAASGLDDGESEAIILADELKSDVLIIDERKGRKVAQNLGIVITGTVGILIQAHYENMISEEEVKICFEYLKNSSIRLSDSLIQEALSIMKNQ